MNNTTEHPHGNQRRRTGAELATDNRASTSRKNPLTYDEIFSLLQNHRRRIILQYLSKTDGQETIGTLAEHLAAEENGITAEEVSSTERKRAYVGLYQTHLPKLAEYGIIKLNKDRGTVEPTETAETFYPYLEPNPTTSIHAGSSKPQSVITAIREWLANRH